MSLLTNQANKSSKPEPKRWLFKAFFSDGSVIEQDEADKCKTRTDGTGSTFTDVLANELNLTHFELHHVDGKQIVGVDLATGAFVVNGTPMHLHNQNFEPEKYEKKLVYFRETRVDQKIKATVQEDGSVIEEEDGEPRHYVNRYFIGWQTQDGNNKNKQVTLAVG